MLLLLIVTLNLFKNDFGYFDVETGLFIMFIEEIAYKSAVACRTL
jgi:hypothetical protein